VSASALPDLREPRVWASYAESAERLIWASRSRNRQWALAAALELGLVKITLVRLGMSRVGN
jgi:hypothetical protein